MKNSSVVKCFYFAITTNNNIFIVGKKLYFENVLYEFPCYSDRLDIFYAKSDFKNESLLYWPVTEISCKLCKLSPCEDVHAFIPLIHTYDQIEDDYKIIDSKLNNNIK